MTKQHFTKLPTSLDEQITLLKDRGLTISDQQVCRHRLSTVSYYQLSAYLKPFESDQISHSLHPGINFDDIWDLYIFDRELRLLFLDALERIEVALRTSLVNTLSQRYGAWWYIDKNVFKSSWFEKNQRTHKSPSEEFKKEIELLCGRGKTEGSIQHFYKKYHSPEFPPSWMLFEYLSFGKCTSLFRYLKDHQDKKGISAVFNQHPNIVESSIEALRYTRNICAHHLRLWDRWFVYKPRRIKELTDANCAPGTLKEQIILLNLFHKAISPKSLWNERLYQLFEKHMTPLVPIHLMGIDSNWRNDLIWNAIK
ncbi:Abi family protein [Legionella gresilensis]|uniref:Abi family protein n=1 Tax=Legionella gresilensis TaxID=91823 RepID=UPI0013EF7D74|nr:Abi family protein [Legionella gresilensis]